MLCWSAKGRTTTCLFLKHPPPGKGPFYIFFLIMGVKCKFTLLRKMWWNLRSAIQKSTSHGEMCLLTWSFVAKERLQQNFAKLQIPISHEIMHSNLTIKTCRTVLHFNSVKVMDDKNYQHIFALTLHLLCTTK